jgi:hypothetical protein
MARLEVSNSYLCDNADAEEALRSSGVPAVIFRCDHIYGSPSQPGPTASAFLAKSGRVTLLGSGTQRLLPCTATMWWKQSGTPPSTPTPPPGHSSLPDPTS